MTGTPKPRAIVSAAKTTRRTPATRATFFRHTAESIDPNAAERSSAGTVPSPTPAIVSAPLSGLPVAAAAATPA